ncbi:DUF429 domain-containing protein [Pelagibacterium sp.]|uniref:DUF429 domain-containing protein n=1 Tax=Pelagibacterium sp. TaxID=1967288 RepID=UPI003A92676D
MTRSVLGIDAAWTAKNPSGVAAIADQGTGWRLIAAAASYQAFNIACGRSDHDPDTADALLESSTQIVGARPDLVAVDMPLARGPITGRRVSDNLISSAFGGHGASTHSPNMERPGAVGAAFSRGFSEAGYDLAVAQPDGPAMIEVYPHPALIALTGAARRLPYKMARIRKYWPELNPAERRVRLVAEWADIIKHLETEIGGLALLNPPPPDARGVTLKAFEDTLDAVICCWIGACVLDKRAHAYGDGFSAVWVPMPIRNDKVAKSCG